MIFLLFFVAVLGALFLWYKRADADLTLLWKHHFGRKERSKFKGGFISIDRRSAVTYQDLLCRNARLGSPHHRRVTALTVDANSM